MHGFEKHAEEDLCVPPHHKTAKLNRNRGPSHIKVAILPPQTAEESCDSSQQCSGIGWYKDSHGFCRICPLMHLYNKTTGVCECPFQSCVPCPNKQDYRIPGNLNAHCMKCPGKMVTLHPFNYYKSPCACPVGMYLVAEDCVPCPHGTYSSFVGNSPCIACSHGLSTIEEGAESRTKCVRMDEREDVLFIHHEAREFYVSSESVLQQMWKNT
jgi:hypothetical protein